MGKRAAVYGACVLMTIYLFLMYDTNALSAALMLEVLYLVVSFLYLRYLCGKIHVGIKEVPAMGEKNQKIKIKFWIHNESRLWNGKYELSLWIGGEYYGKDLEKRITQTIEARSKKILPFMFESSYCGNIEIGLEKLRIYDFLGLFYKTVHLTEKTTIGILPVFELIPLEITRRTREFPADADEHSVEKSGDDPSAIYQVREYQPWDSLHDVHWKLTAKEDTLIVKEYGFPLGCVILIWLDFSDIKKSREGFGKMLEKAAALCLTLMEEKCVHMAAWFEEKNARVVKWKISKDEDVYELIWQLLDMEPYKHQDVMQVYYEDAFRGDHFSTIVQIDGTGTITVNGQQQEFLRL